LPDWLFYYLQELEELEKEGRAFILLLQLPQISCQQVLLNPQRQLQDCSNLQKANDSPHGLL